MHAANRPHVCAWVHACACAGICVRVCVHLCMFVLGSSYVPMCACGYACMPCAPGCSQRPTVPASPAPWRASALTLPTLGGPRAALRGGGSVQTRGLLFIAASVSACLQLALCLTAHCFLLSAAHALACITCSPQGHHTQPRHTSMHARSTLHQGTAGLQGGRGLLLTPGVFSVRTIVCADTRV